MQPMWPPAAQPQRVPTAAKPPAAAPKPTKPQKPDLGASTRIGTNPAGRELFEDARGVRSYVENGLRVTEPVRMGPRGEFNGVADRSKEFKTTEELATQAAPANAAAPALSQDKPTSSYTVYRGSGRASKEAVYSEYASGGVFTDNATYYAFDQGTAKQYGPNVETRTVQPKNPLVLRTDKDFVSAFPIRNVNIITQAMEEASRRGLRGDDFDADVKKRVGDISRQLFDFAVDKGYDAIEVRLAKGDASRRLTELMGHDQLIVLTPESKSAAAGVPGVAKSPDAPPDAQPGASTQPPVRSDAPGMTPSPGFLSNLSAEKQARADELKKRLRAKLDGSQLNTGFDPEIVSLGAELGALYIEAGAKRFKDWAKAVRSDLGERIDPYLPSLYLAARRMPGVDRTDTDSAEYVDSLTDEQVRSMLNEGTADDGPGVRGPTEPSAGGAQPGVVMEPRGGVVPEGDAVGGAGDGGRTGTEGTSPQGVPAGVASDPGSGDGTGAGGRDAGGSVVGRDPGSPDGDGARADGARDDGPGRSERDAGDGAAASASAPGNFVITKPELLGLGSPKAKYRANVAALQTYRRVLSEGRAPTREEQQIMSQWVGWGMFPQLFNYDSSWRKEAQEFRELVSAEEWNSARQSTLNAHYTSAKIVRAMWDMARRMGFTGGRILEPGMGIGNFFGLMPQDFEHGAAIAGVEMDTLTGGMAKMLYPQAAISINRFEKTPLPHNFFDLVISNVPFADVRPFDKEYNQHGASLHDYYFLKSIDRVRPGGLVMFITSRYTLDKQNDTIRKVLAEKARLVAAFRLPDGAFEQNAGTQVVTDIIILQRKWSPSKAKDERWLGVGTVPDPAGGEPIEINNYYVDNPQNVLGQVDRSGTMYAKNQPNVSMPVDFDDRLERAIRSLPVDTYTPTGEQAGEVAELEKMQSATGMKRNAITIKDGKAYQNVNGELVEIELNAADTARLKAVLSVRDSTKTLLEAERAGEPDARLAELREALNREYDGLVRKHGFLHKPALRELFRTDPESGLLLSLEIPDGKDAKGKDQWKKAGIFTARQIRAARAPDQAGTVRDAMLISLDETGGVSPARIAALTGKSVADVEKQLGDEQIAFLDPSDGWVAASEYLAGNVKAKLVAARTAAEVDPKFQPNVVALEAVQPKDLEAADIVTSFGSVWIPTSDYQEFIAGLLDTDARFIQLSLSATTGAWIIETPRDEVRRSPEARQKWGTPQLPFFDLAALILNRKPVVVTRTERDGDKTVTRVDEVATAEAVQKAREIEDSFIEWVWSDDARRKRLKRQYNDTFNVFVDAKFDGAHLTFPGISPTLGFGVESTLRPSQRNAVMRIIRTMRGLLAHEVGAGKTLTYIAAAMELKRLGKANKIVLTGMNANAAQMAQEARRAYPSARILDITAAKDADERRSLIAQIATSDWDLIVMTHKQFVGIPVTPDSEAEQIQEQIRELEAAYMEARLQDVSAGRGTKNSSRFVKQLAKAIERLKKGADEVMSRKSIKSDDVIFFENTGIDFVFVDEAHEFKKMPIASALNVKGAPKAGDESGYGLQLAMKSKIINRVQGAGRGVVIGTGTPITNLLHETYNWMRILQADELTRMGVQAFDAWAREFTVIENRTEYSAAGEYKEVSRLAKYQNVVMLQTMMRSVLDAVRIDRINAETPEAQRVKRPGRIDRLEELPLSYAQRRYLDEVKYRARNLKGGPPTKGADNMLSISGDARKAAIDMRLVDINGRDHPDNKVNRCATRIAEFVEKHPGTTHMVFCEFRRNEQSGFDLFKDLADKLVAKGIPKAKIARVEDVTAEKRSQLWERMNSGDVWVVMGTTKTMGTGVNAQKRLVALHHLDAPWMPGDLEQRDGRGWRKGNENPTGKIHLYRYATVGSFDTFMWQALARKQKFINQFFSDENIQESVEWDDVEALSPDQIYAITAGNPILLEKIELERRLRELSASRRAHQKGQTRARDDISNADDTIKTVQRETIPAIEKDRDQALKTKDDEWSVTVEGKVYTDPDAATSAMLDLVKDVAIEWRKGYTVGEHRGFRVQRWSWGWTLTGPSGRTYTVNLWTDGGDGIRIVFKQSAATVLGEAAWERRIGEANDEIARANRQKAIASEQLGKPFAGEQELQKSEARFKEIEPELKRLAEEEKKREEQRQAAEAKVERLNDAQLRDANRQLGLSDRGERDELRDRVLEALPPDAVGDWIGQWFPNESMGAAPNPAMVRTEDGDRIAKIRTADEIDGDEGAVREPGWGEDKYPLRIADNDRFRAAYGIGQPTLRQRLTLWWERLREDLASWTMRGAVPELPRLEWAAEAREAARQIRHSSHVAMFHTKEAMRRALAPLRPADWELFTKVVVFEDLANTDGPLPFGLTSREEAAAEAEWLLAEAKKNPRVTEALEARRSMWRAWKEDYEAAGKAVGWDVGSKLTRGETYYRHQVLHWMRLKMLDPKAARRTLEGTGPTQRSTLRTGRGFLKRREGSEKDINTNVLEAEWEVLTLMRADALMMRQLAKIRRKYDILPDLKKQARVDNMRLMREHYNQEAGNPIDGETLFNVEMKQGIARALQRIRGLVEDGVIDIGAGDRFMSVLSFTDPSDDGAEIRDVYAWASWAASNAEHAESQMAARMLLAATADRKKKISEVLGSRERTWEDYVPADFEAFQVRPGRVVFMADSIPDRIAESIMLTGGDGMELKLTPDDISKFMALGQPYTPWVMPREVAAMLRNIKPIMRGPTEKAIQNVTRGWKWNALMRPDNWVLYRFRNQTEILKVLAIAPGALQRKYLTQSIEDMRRLFLSGEVGQNKSVRAWMERGGAAAMVRVQEIYEVNALDVLKDLAVTKNETGIGYYFGMPTRAIRAMVDKQGQLNDMLESLYRYAAFLYFRDQIKANGGGVTNYAASVPADIDGLSDDQDKAFRLSNDLLGAYDDVSKFGDMLRRGLIPFWAFQELNLRTHVQAIRNAWTRPELTIGAGATLVKKAVRAGRILPAAAARLGAGALAAIGRIGIMYVAGHGLLYAINRLLLAALGEDWEEYKADLPKEVRTRAFLALGRDGAGRPLYVDRLGAFDDVLEWFGMTGVDETFRDVLSGRRTLMQAVGDIAKASPNKLYQGVTPFVKAPAEMASGLSTFPDVFKSRPRRDQDPMLYLAQMMDAEGLYRRATNLPDPPPMDLAAKTFVRFADPGASDYFAVRDHVRRVMQQEGRGGGHGAGGQKSLALYYARQAIRWRDQKAALYWHARYRALGGTQESARDSLANLAPLAGVPQNLRGRVMVGLDEDMLKRAERYYAERVIADERLLARLVRESARSPTSSSSR